ncbi:MAG TPA: DUF5615 family PIN-like protein [Candidatus Acidoferrum sp.]|nr:DUF5615 family PIN-like protein [Candidatus Acidoferrum sp.]
MRLLLDANLSPRLVGLLVGAGHDAVHVTAVGLLTAADTAIFDYAAAPRRRPGEFLRRELSRRLRAS